MHLASNGSITGSILAGGARSGSLLGGFLSSIITSVFIADGRHALSTCVLDGGGVSVVAVDSDENLSGFGVYSIDGDGAFVLFAAVSAGSVELAEGADVKVFDVYGSSAIAVGSVSYC